MRKLLLAFTILLLPALCTAQDHDLVSRPMGSAYRGDHAALEQLRLIANGGNAEAQFDMGQAYEWGWAVRIDMSQAVGWYRKAAEQGDRYAQYNLGVHYANGNGIPKNSVLAAMWYRKAAEQDYIDAQVNLAIMYGTGDGIPQDFPQAALWFGKAAARGNSTAQNGLGTMYAVGYGVPRDMARAMELNLEAAEQGVVQSMYFAGTVYALGDGIPKDLAKAAGWFAKAIDSFENAQAGVAEWIEEGRRYYSGEGRFKSLVISDMWLDMAALKGDETAAKLREETEREMTSDQIAEAKELFTLLQKAGPPKINFPEIGAEVPSDVVEARNPSQVCRVDTNRTDPCASIKIHGFLFTVAWDEDTKAVTYIFTDDASLIMDSELSVGGLCRIAEFESQLVHYFDWLLTTQWADTSREVSGYAVWYAALKKDSAHPDYGTIVGFIQSRYINAGHQP